MKKKKGSGSLEKTHLMTVIITEEALFIVSIPSQHKGRMKDLKRSLCSACKDAKWKRDPTKVTVES